MENPLHQRIVPMPAVEAEDVLIAHHLAIEFRAELYSREVLEQHCRWYEKISLQHQQELAAMQKEVNLFRLFRR